MMRKNRIAPPPDGRNTRNEDSVRKKDDTMHDTLLHLARSIADTDGIGAVSIRAIAGRAGIATGTVYNYFSNKDEILLALTEQYWIQTLAEMKTAVTADSFCGQLKQIFIFLRDQIDRSAGKLMSSLGALDSKARTRMASMQSALEQSLLQSMEGDGAIRENIWNEQFTKQQFTRFVMSSMTAMLRTRAPVSDFDFFLTIIKNTIY